jgi:hypothetical protein
MKRIVFASLAGLALFTTAQAQDNDKKETIEGNGNIVTKEIPVSSFDALKASGVYELKLSQGDKESVRVEADENLQAYFTIRNEGSKLVIDMDKIKNKNFNPKSHLKVYITFKKLKEIELNTVGNVASQEKLSFDNLDLNTHGVGNVDLNMSVSKLDMENTGVGDVKLSGKGTDVVVKNKGVGSLHAGDFVVQTMNIENTGVGSATVNAEKDLKVKDSFLGKVKNRGNANVRKMNKVRV